MCEVQASLRLKDPRQFADGANASFGDRPVAAGPPEASRSVDAAHHRTAGGVSAAGAMVRWHRDASEKPLSASRETDLEKPAVVPTLVA